MATNKIPILDLGPEIEAHWQELNTSIQNVLRSGQFIQGPDVKRLEAELGDYLGVKHVVTLNSGTDALVIGLRALGIGPGDEVITTAFTFFATAEAVSLLGATPVFVDIDPVTFNLDAGQIEGKITPCTKAIIPVHLYGHSADMDAIMAIAARHRLKVLEDVAQAFSGKHKGRQLGTLGDAGAFSFFPSKNLGCYGDGGMLATNDDAIADAARMLRAHGAKQKYFNEIVAYNSRLDTIQAAILRVKLPHIEAASAGRRQVASVYRELLSPLSDKLVLPTEASYARHVFHQYTVRVLNGRRDELQQALSAQGIETMIYYRHPMHRLPVYRAMELSLPITEQATAEVLSLPIWPQMSADTQGRVADAITTFFH